MRVLGLQPATIMENGDLRLPNGNMAVHRDVAHIWKQRGARMDQLGLSTGGKKRFGPPSRVPLMISGTAQAGSRLAMTTRQQARQGKKIIAILRSSQKEAMRLGMSQNKLQVRRVNRTGFGDASGGR